MSKNIYISSVLFLLMLGSSGGCVGQIVYFFAYAPLAQHNKLRVAALIWFGTSAAVDSSIAISLLWQLRRIKSPFKATRSLVHKLILNAITTGTLTFLFSAIPLVLFLVDDRANLPGVTALAEGRVFALTMLYSLNSRRSIRHGETNTSDAHSMTIKTATDTTNTSHVNHPATVHVSLNDHELPTFLKDEPK